MHEWSVDLMLHYVISYIYYHLSWTHPGHHQKSWEMKRMRVGLQASDLLHAEEKGSREENALSSSADLKREQVGPLDLVDEGPALL